MPLPEDKRKLAGKVYANVKIFRPTIYNRETGEWVPNPDPRPDLKELYDMGMLRKEQLVHGKYYGGYCRNAEVARWNAEEQMFSHVRHKFGSAFEEDIAHPADDHGYDVFVPVAEVTPTPAEEVVEGFSEQQST